LDLPDGIDVGDLALSGHGFQALQFPLLGAKRPSLTHDLDVR